MDLSYYQLHEEQAFYLASAASFSAIIILAIIMGLSSGIPSSLESILAVSHIQVELVLEFRLAWLIVQYLKRRGFFSEESFVPIFLNFKCFLAV